MQATLIITDATDSLTYCDCCGEDCSVLVPSPVYGDEQMVCESCRAEQQAEIDEAEQQEAIDAARDAAEEAYCEVSDIEEEIAELKRRYDEDMEEARERLRDAKKASAVATAKLRALAAGA